MITARDPPFASAISVCIKSTFSNNLNTTSFHPFYFAQSSNKKKSNNWTIFILLSLLLLTKYRKTKTKQKKKVFSKTVENKFGTRFQIFEHIGRYGILDIVRGAEKSFDFSLYS